MLQTNINKIGLKKQSNIYVFGEIIVINKMYQDNRNNCVFVGYDTSGITRYAL